MCPTIARARSPRWVAFTSELELHVLGKGFLVAPQHFVPGLAPGFHRAFVIAMTVAKDGTNVGFNPNASALDVVMFALRTTQVAQKTATVNAEAATAAAKVTAQMAAWHKGTCFVCKVVQGFCTDCMDNLAAESGMTAALDADVALPQGCIGITGDHEADGLGCCPELSFF